MKKISILILIALTVFVSSCKKHEYCIVTGLDNSAFSDGNIPSATKSKAEKELQSLSIKLKNSLPNLNKKKDNITFHTTDTASLIAEYEADQKKTLTKLYTKVSTEKKIKYKNLIYIMLKPKEELIDGKLPFVCEVISANVPYIKKNKDATLSAHITIEKPVQITSGYKHLP